MFCWCCFTSIYKNEYMNQSDKFMYHTLYTTYSSLYWFYDDVIQVFLIFWSDHFSLVMKWEKKNEQESDTDVCERCVILCPEVRCVTCAQRPLLRKVLFPEQPHPEHHEDDYFHPPHPTQPHPTPGLRLKTQHANPACPNRLGDWHSNNDTAFVLPPFLSLISPYALHILQLNPVALV